MKIESQTYHVSTNIDKLTCSAKLAHSYSIRPLIDTGANICLCSEKVFQCLPARFRFLNKTPIRIQSASGDPLIVKGTVTLPIKIGSQTFNQEFVVTSNLKYSAILGLNFMRTNNVKINLTDNILTLGRENIKMSSLTDIIAQGRMSASMNVPPQTISFVNLKPHTQIIDKDAYYQVSTGDSTILNQEPGLYLANTIAKLNEGNYIPALLINSTGRNFRLSTGNVIAKLTPTTSNDYDIYEISTESKSHFDYQSEDLDPKYDVHNFKMNNSNISEKDSARLKELLIEFQDQFAKHTYDIGKAVNTEVSISLTDTKPIARRPFKIPLSLQADVQQQIASMLKFDIIKESTSPWQFPLVTVKKSRENTNRVCVDLRSLNKVVSFFSFPMMNLDSILGRLSKASYFSTVDLNQAYLNLPVRECDQDILSFVTDYGKYAYKRLCFGLSTAPSIFSSYLVSILRGLDNCISYLDDILIFSNTISDHFDHLRALFGRLRQNNLKAKLPKCAFFCSSLRYLGFIITKEGLKPDEEKLIAIKNMAPPTTVTAVRSYLGMLNFYRRFLPNFAQIAKPLIELTHKNAKFQWNSDRQKSFETLKNHLISDQVLIYPNINRPFEIYSDASKDAIGACLVQRDKDGYARPCYFISHNLNGSQKKWSTTELEMYAIIYALNKLRTIIYGCDITVFTDHRPLTSIQSSKVPNAKLQRWCLILNDYHIKIVYLPGKSNLCADFLSRYVSPKDTCNLINTDRLEEQTHRF